VVSFPQFPLREKEKTEAPIESEREKAVSSWSGTFSVFFYYLGFILSVHVNSKREHDKLSLERGKANGKIISCRNTNSKL